MRPEPRIRPAVPADATAIAVAQVEGWRAAYAGLMPEALLAGLSVEERASGWRARIDDPASPEHRCFVVEVAGVVMGFASTGPSRDAGVDSASVAEVYALYLAPGGWGRGLGRALFAAAVDDLAGRDRAAVTLWVLEGNARARRFYEAAGMRADGGAKVEVEEGVDLPHVRYALPLRGPARG